MSDSKKPTVDYKQFAILYVDDEPANLATFRYCFEDRFWILTAPDGQEALKVLGREPVAVLLTDQRMPGMSGVELCAQAREHFTDVVRIVVTAYADITDAVAAINKGAVSRYILKPWREDAMADILRAGIDAFHLGALTRELQLRLLQAEQSTTTTFLLGRVLHELGNPATAVHDNVRFMKDTLCTLAPLVAGQSGAIVELVNDLQGAVEDASEAVGQLVARIDRFRRGDPPTPARPEGNGMAQAVKAAAAILRAEIRKKAELVLDLDADFRVAADQVQLSQILVNLLMNACEAIDSDHPDDNRILVRLRTAGGCGYVDIEDTGAGIAPDALPRIFEPFFTSKGATGPRGFGLAIVRELVQILRGNLSVEAGPRDRGTRFTIELPLI